jgi:hypothetical protein
MWGVGLSRRRADWEIIDLAPVQADPGGVRGSAPAAGGVKTGVTRYYNVHDNPRSSAELQ